MPDVFINHGFSDLNSPITQTPQYLSLQPKKNAVLVSHGRPPWYSIDGKRLCDAYVVGVAGGSGSGKVVLAALRFHVYDCSDVQCLCDRLMLPDK